MADIPPEAGLDGDVATSPGRYYGCIVERTSGAAAARPPYAIGVLEGEGIGPEVIACSLRVLDALSALSGLEFRIEKGGAIGLGARRRCGAELSEDVIRFCRETFARRGAILAGPGGGRFVEDLLQEAHEVIEARSGTANPTPGTYRAFFQDILQLEDLEKYPSFLNFVLSSDVLAAVGAYLGCIPVLSTTLPRGVRLVESSAAYDGSSLGAYRESQLFHADYYSKFNVYVIVLLRDVTAESGPFSFLPISTSRQVAAACRYWSRGVPYRLSDEQVYAVVPRSELHELTYPRGTVLFIDPSQCFHFGSRDAVIPSYMMMYWLNTVCRTDLSEFWYEKARFPTREGDSRLRRARGLLERSIGGEGPDRPGPHERAAGPHHTLDPRTYFPPTIVCCDDPQDEVVQEETFGPVLVVQGAADWHQALALCNGVRQGLAAALFSSSSELQEQFLFAAEAGILKLNRSTADAELDVPFGGWKASGIGPAEHGECDREFYTRAQAIYPPIE